MSQSTSSRHYGLALAILLCSFVDTPFGLRPFLHAIRAPASAPPAPAVQGHSHNDYEQSLPLMGALEAGFHSVEADIWLREGQLELSHFGLIFSGRLQDTYLAPLQHRVNRLGSVYGDRAPFYLWLDIKDPNPELLDRLQASLAAYPMLTRFTDGAVTPGTVTVILTGLESAKRAYVENFPVRYATRDSHRFQETDPPADDRWSWYALNWWNYFSWNGHGAMPEAQADYLKLLVMAIHGKGRRVRFWNAPDTEAAWAASRSADVDLVETDSLEDFRRFAAPPLRPSAAPTDEAPGKDPRTAPGSI